MFDIPETWGLTPMQEVVIGSLIDEAGTYITPADLHKELYEEKLPKGAPAPAKLRVLVQRCRDILLRLSGGKVEIVTKKRAGWKITKAGRSQLRKLVDGD